MINSKCSLNPDNRKRSRKGKKVEGMRNQHHDILVYIVNTKDLSNRPRVVVEMTRKVRKDL